MVGPDTQFKITARRMRQLLFSLGYTYIEVYNRLLSFKLRRKTYYFTVTALTTATTAGCQYTSPNAQVWTVQESAAVNATTLKMSGGPTPPDDASSTLTFVASSAGTAGTHQATIAYSAFSKLPGDLGPYQSSQSDITHIPAL